jgi:uncharacterized membrane protein YgcG
MSYWKSLTFAAISAALFVGTAAAPGQVTIGIGVAPACPYGYYDYAPYSCSPYGYYGPDWFHGGNGFYGHVDNRYDPRNGYAGPMPGRGDRPFNHFQANEARDGQGHVGNAGHSGSGEHSAGSQGGNRGGGGSHGGGHPR